MKSNYRKRELAHTGTIEERLALLTGYAQASDVPEPTYACPCLDTGWVAVDEGTNTVKPCAPCRPESYERWAEGKWLASGARKVVHTETQAERDRRDLL